jgi:spore germination protein YaaH
MRKIVIIVGSLLVVFLTLFVILFIIYPTASPFTSAKYIVQSWFNPHKNMQKQVIGFLPYWRLDDSQYIHFNELTEISYFSLSADKDGNIVKISGNETEPGWREWNGTQVKDLIAKTQITGNAFSFTLAMQKNSVIEGFLDNKNAQENLMINVIQEVKNRHINGVILDVEYLGKPDSKYREAFTSFANTFYSQMKKELPNVSISLTLLPRSGRDDGLFNLSELSPYFDRFIGMTYDYYTPGSDIAGPVAPLHGFAEKQYFFDVVTSYQDYTKYISPSKLIMGVPYYGYDWPVENGAKKQSVVLPQNDTNGYAAAMSYGRMRADTDIKTNQCTWDDMAQEMWCYYVDPKTNVDHQVWIGDARSMNAKYQFAKTQKLAGVAIWTLGYDKSYPDLWNVLEKNLLQSGI